MKRKWVPATIWAMLIFLTSSTVIHSKAFIHGVVDLSNHRVSPTAFEGFWHSWWWVFVKGYHVMEYTLLCLLIHLAVSGRAMRRGVRIALATLAAFLFACSDEYHQTFVPTRGGKWTDVAIDCIGITIASVTLLLLTRRKLSTA